MANNPKPGRKRESETRTGKGEHQIALYVAGPGIGECSRILAFEPEGLPWLAALRGECRVRRNEERTLEEVIRTWTVALLAVLRAVPAYRRYWKVELGPDGRPEGPHDLAHLTRGKVPVRITGLAEAGRM